MSANLAQAIFEKIQALTDEEQQEVLALVEAILNQERTSQPAASARPIADIFEELSSQIPLNEWAELPADGAEQHDHYLYNSPKHS